MGARDPDNPNADVSKNLEKLRNTLILLILLKNLYLALKG